ncbi:hypothetical protein BOX15_Mlig013689g1 [Macrostomum lignano]|uniref:Cytochrome b561 domain-containing protein n=2 Tax=Macrostomum lignano TaxID=282301 RepID=A0A267DRD4_9PLAT|nr:hypothetical protein BOX15_Mlig013689g1 [Macrostomum lignano]
MASTSKLLLLSLALASTLTIFNPGCSAQGQKADAPLYPVLCDPAREGCIKSPLNCRSVYRGVGSSTIDEQQCNYVAAWRYVGGDLEVEISGQIGLNGGFVALGFSPDKKASSGLALACFKSSKSSNVAVQLAAYRSGDLTELLALPSVLTEADSVPHFEPDQPQVGGFYYALPKLGYSVIECRARLRLSASSDARLNFLKRPRDPSVYMTASLGTEPPSPSGEGLDKPTWTYTTPARKLSVVGVRASQPRSGLAKAHGCFMILAWVLCASIGTLIARYYKLQWPGRLLGREAFWFQLHRILMGFTCCLTLLSFILIFIDLRGYSGLDSFPELLHPILGIIVTILTFMNPLIALCRCDPSHENRPCFNWIHWLVGTIAYVLAVLNLFLGLRLERAGDLSSINYHIWLLIFFVLFQFIVEIILEIHTLYHWKRNKKLWQAYRLELEEYNTAKTNPVSLQPRSRPLEPLPRGRCLRVFLMSLHGVVAAAVACILCIVVLAY